MVRPSPPPGATSGKAPLHWRKAEGRGWGSILEKHASGRTHRAWLGSGEAGGALHWSHETWAGRGSVGGAMLAIGRQRLLRSA